MRTGFAAGTPQALLAAAARPTAVLCITDRLALGAIAAVQQEALIVPGDVSIVGFDDIPLAGQARPSLTTVRQAHRDKGLLAGQALVRHLRGEAEAEHTTLPVQLVVRGSTGPDPHHERDREQRPASR